ncbi:MAG: type IX secretion system sortase PorU [Paludibacteraceae bacterium]|nr:type IX secretion system sortase PorU [Paludibacteraceae bacterium]
MFALLFVMQALLCSLSSAATIHSFADNSVLSSGKWVRVAVSSSGVYKITYENLKQWGINDPSNPRVFGYGGAKLSENFSDSKIDDLPQLHIWMEKGADGVFNAGDYILFYAQGPVSWKYATTGQFTHTLNPYSDYGYYFITSDVGTEKLINNNVQPSLSVAAGKTVTSFKDYSVFEEESYNLISSGQRWFGETFTNSSVHDFDFSFPNIRTDSAMKVAVSMAANASSKTSVVLSHGAQSSTLSLAAKTSLLTASDNLLNVSLTPSSDDFTLGLKYNGSSQGTAWLDYIEVNAYRNLVMSGSYMPFREPSVTGESAVAYQLAGSDGIVVWDMTDPSAIKNMQTTYSDGKYSFVADASILHEYVAVKPSAYFPAPTFVGEVANQNLHAVTNADFVIISPEEYLEYANRLADLHSHYDGISTLVVTPQQIYNEYSSGTPDATAFRWLMKSIYERASDGRKPQNLLLFGDATYDHRGYLKANVPYNKVLTYESINSLHVTTGSYATDDYFGMLADETGSLLYDSMSIGVGRLPVSSPSQANAMVNKVQTYLRDSLKGEWKNRLVYIADDDNDANLCYTWQSDTLAKRMEREHKEFQVTRLFTDAFSKVVTSNSASYPEVQYKIMQLFSDGTLFFDYTGHGSTEGLAAEKFFDRNDITNLYNKKYPFFYTATCDYGDYDKSTLSSGEEVMLREKGGAIALVTACRTVYADGNFTLNGNYHKHFLTKENGKPITFGESFRRAKNTTAKGSGASNRLPYVLLGDPALRFPLPSKKIVVDSVNMMKQLADGGLSYKYPVMVDDNLRNKFQFDTIKALSIVRIKGRVLDETETNIDKSFNGIVSIVVQDKLRSIKTLGYVTGGETTYTYKDRVNTLFKGKVNVKDGAYELLFLVPKDIGYDYDFGRINLYAKNDSEDVEANGFNEDFVIGGTNENVEFEDNSPIINMYINSPFFKSGGVIDGSSILYATLSDENGINTTGSGIGHDLQLKIEGDTTLIINLNDYYENDLGTYKSGHLKYTLPELNPGNYTLTLRAWDLMNNSASESLAFKLKVGKKTGVYRMYAYPNPVDKDGTVNFVVEHDQPETELLFKLEIYDTAGNVLFRNNQEFYNDGSKATISVKADGLLRPGVYPYRIWTDTDANGEDVKTNKLIVK